MKKILFVLFCFLSVSGFSQDLIITAVSGSMSFDAYDIYSGSITVKNTGIVGSTSGLVVNSYLSKDSIFDSSDLYIGEGYTPSINAGQTKVLPIDWGEQIKIQTGTYYLIAVVNNNPRYAEETDYTNNTYVKSGFVVNAGKFDFRFTSFSIPDTIYLLETFYPQFQITNPGKYSTTDRLFTSFYFSKDQVLDDSDVYSGKYSDWLDAPLDDTHGYPWDALTVPVTTGQYYIIAKVDADNDFHEIDETNNISVSGLMEVKEARVDLRPYNLSLNPAPSDAPAGTILMADVGVTNVGTTSAYSIYFQASLSSDPYPGGYDDQMIQANLLSDPLPQPPPYIGSHQSKTFSLSLSSNFEITPGAYYVIVYVYPGGNFNNSIITTYPINIGTSSPKAISIESANFTGVYGSWDKNLKLETGFKNNGSTYFGDLTSYQVTIRDQFNAIQYSGGVSQYLSLYPGQTTTENLYIILDNGLPLGTYTVDLTCADNAKCNSDNYSLQLKIDQPIRTLSGKIQGEDGTPITNGKLFLYQKHDDGSVSFTQKITPITSSDFAFPVDWRQYTLYFIPDANDYPQYVPTIFGKTVTLSPSNFIKISKDSTITFEILKVHSLASGSQTVSGNISTGAISGASYSKGNTVKSMTVAAPITVLLLNEQGDVVGITQTDASGNFAFTNLPAAKYQVIVPFELDQPSLMKTPFAVDVTTESKDVTFNFASGAPVTVVKILQVITFDEFQQVTYVHAPIALNASSSSGLSITYSSSNPSVATVADNQVAIVGVGTTTITASQSGNADYKASELNHDLVVDKGVLHVIAENKTKNYDDANPPLTFNFDGFKSNENLDNSGVTAPTITTSASQNSNAGAYAITFTGGDAGSNYAFDFVGATLTISKIDQSITFNTELQDFPSDANPINLQAQATSGLPVTFSITEGKDIVVLNNATLTLTGKSGTVTVEASQNGDVNHNSALPVAKSFKVNIVLDVKPDATLITMCPNPTNSELKITSGTPIINITLWDMLGHKINEIENVNLNEYQMNLSGYTQGTYLVTVTTKDGASISSRVVLTR